MSSALQLEYVSRIAETLFRFQQDEILCDIIIQTQDCQIAAHRVILAAASPNLRELLNSKDACADRKPVIQLEGYDLSVAKLWLEFMYTGRCSWQPNSVKQFRDVMSLCEALQMPKPVWNVDKTHFTKKTENSCFADEFSSSITNQKNTLTEKIDEGCSDTDDLDATGNESTSNEQAYVLAESSSLEIGFLENPSLMAKVEQHSIETSEELRLLSDLYLADKNKEVLQEKRDTVEKVDLAFKREITYNNLFMESVTDCTANDKKCKTNESSVSSKIIRNRTTCKMLLKSSPNFKEFLIASHLEETSNSMVPQPIGNSGENNESTRKSSNISPPVSNLVKPLPQDCLEQGLSLKGSTLKCRFCGCSRFIDIRRTSDKAETFSVIYKCLECGEQILTSEDLELPVVFQPKKNSVKVSQKNIHTCNLCGKAFGTHSGLFGHLAKHPLSQYNETTCAICKTTFPDQNAFLNHVLIYGGSNRNQRSGARSVNRNSVKRQVLGDHKQKSDSAAKMTETVLVKSNENTKTDLRMGSHKCPICAEMFWTHASLYRHTVQHQFLHITDSNLPTCGICMTNFETISQLEDHVTSKAGRAVFDQEVASTVVTRPVNIKKKNLTSRKVYECGYCKRIFGNPGGLQSHVKMHTEGRRYKCPSCGDCFRFSKHLSNHARMFHNMYVCSKCGLDCSCTVEESKARQLASENSLVRTKRFPCADCKKSFSTQKGLRGHQTMHESITNFVCEICGLSFRRRDRLAVHKFMHVSKPYPCQFCKKCFLTAVRLEEHMRTHTGECPIVCSHCGKHFKTRSTLRVHLIRNHSSLHRLKVINHKCHICGRQFSSKGYLMLHIKWHGGKFRSYKCPLCCLAFYDPHAVRKHMVIHAESRERPFVCYICGKSFVTQGNLKTHSVSHASERLFTCDLCNKGFKFKSNLKKHYKVHEKSDFSVDSITKMAEFERSDNDLVYTCEEEVVLNVD